MYNTMTVLTVKKIKLNSGFSVLEVLISSLILLILMGISSKIMYQSLRLSKEETGLAFIRKEAVKAVNWFNNDLRRSSGDSFTYNTYPVSNLPLSITFLTNQSNVLNNKGGTDPNCFIVSPRWDNYVIYYLTPDSKNPATAGATQKYLLKRTIFIPSDPYYDVVFKRFMTTPRPLRSGDLTVFLNKCILLPDTAPDRPGTVARNIYEINVIERTWNYVTLTIETRDKNPRGGELKTLYTSRVFMRNSDL